MVEQRALYILIHLLFVTLPLTGGDRKGPTVLLPAVFLHAVGDERYSDSVSVFSTPDCGTCLVFLIQ